MFCEIPKFGRCCFCLPLRQGVLVFGYLNLAFSVLMVGIYSYCIHNNARVNFVMFHGMVSDTADVISLIIYLCDCLLNILLVIGAHQRIVVLLKVFCFYVLTTVGAVVVLEVLEIINCIRSERHFFLEMVPAFVIGLALNLYLYFLVRSLLKKIENSGVGFENQLHQFVNGEVKLEENGVYPPTVVPIETA